MTCCIKSGHQGIHPSFTVTSFAPLFFQTSKMTATIWQLQAAIISQLHLIRFLSIIIAIIHPGYDGRSVKTFSAKLKLCGWILSSTDVHFSALGDSIVGSCCVITAVHSSCTSCVEPMLLKNLPPVPPHPQGKFIWEPFNRKEQAISLANDDEDFEKQDTRLKALVQTNTSPVTNGVSIWYTLHRPDTNKLVMVGSEVVSLDGLCPAFNACPNPNIFQHHFGIKFHHKGHSYVQAISPYKFVRCFGFIDQMMCHLSHPTNRFAMDAAMAARTSAWLLKQAHSYLAYLRDANGEVFLPNHFTAPATAIQAFVNGAIGVRLPSKERWIQAYSDDTKMSAIRDLVTNPSKINDAAMSKVNYNYWAPLRNSQIMLEDGLLIYREPIRGGSSYTHLQLVPDAFYNIIFITFHSNAIGRHLNAYRTLHCIRLRYYWLGMFSYIKRMCTACPGCALQTLQRANLLNWFTTFLSKRLSLSFSLMHTWPERILVLMVLRHT